MLITGGGGGVGAHLARNFAKLNARVVIWDINKEGKQAKNTLLTSIQNYNEYAASDVFVFIRYA